MRAKTSGILDRRRLLKAGGAAIAGATLGPLLLAERTSAQTRTIYVNTWVPVLPGVMIFLTSMAFNLLSDGLRDAMDVRL